MNEQERLMAELCKMRRAVNQQMVDQADMTSGPFLDALLGFWGDLIHAGYEKADMQAVFLSDVEEGIQRIRSRASVLNKWIATGEKPEEV